MRSAFIFMLVLFIFISIRLIFIAIWFIFILIWFVFIPIWLINMLIGNINRTERKKQKRSGKQKGHLPTAVTRNGEKCGKFTFIFRKKFYLSRKYAVPKFATSCSRGTLVVSSRNYADIHNFNSLFSSAKRNGIRLRWNFSSRSLKN